MSEQLLKSAKLILDGVRDTLVKEGPDIKHYFDPKVKSRSNKTDKEASSEFLKRWSLKSDVINRIKQDLQSVETKLDSVAEEVQWVDNTSNEVLIYTKDKLLNYALYLKAQFLWVTFKTKESLSIFNTIISEKRYNNNEILCGCYYYIGQCYIDLNDPKSALVSLQSAYDVDKDSSLANIILQDIDDLEKGRIGKKEFIGSWKILLITAGLGLLGLFTGNFLVFLLFGSIAGGYFYWKFK